MSFERWVFTKLAGISQSLGDEEFGGEIVCPASRISDTERFLVVVKGGGIHDARTVEDLWPQSTSTTPEAAS